MPRRRRPRGLSPEERALWQRVADSTEPMHRRPDPTSPAPPDPGAAPRHRAAERPAPPADFRLGGRAEPRPPDHDLAPPIRDRLAAAPVRMDRKAHKRMTRGKLPVEGRLDLHGLTLAQAQPRLVHFLNTSYSSGKRLVLIITGKGREDAGDDPVPRPRGILRDQIPHWLAMPPLSRIVLQVTPAHRSHGGSGAYYVYLRRSR